MVWPFSSVEKNEVQQPAARPLADTPAEALESVNPELEAFYRQAAPDPAHLASARGTEGTGREGAAGEKRQHEVNPSGI